MSIRFTLTIIRRKIREFPRPQWWVLGMSLLWTMGWTLLKIRRYTEGHATVFDLGNTAPSLYVISHGHSLACNSFLNEPIVLNTDAYILYLLARPFRFLSGPYFLLALQFKQQGMVLWSTNQVVSVWPPYVGFFATRQCRSQNQCLRLASFDPSLHHNGTNPSWRCLVGPPDLSRLPCIGECNPIRRPLRAAFSSGSGHLNLYVVGTCFYQANLTAISVGLFWIGEMERINGSSLQSYWIDKVA